MQVIDPCSAGQLDPVELEKAINAVRAPGGPPGQEGHWLQIFFEKKTGVSCCWDMMLYFLVVLSQKQFSRQLFASFTSFVPDSERFVRVTIRCERMKLGDVRMLNPEASTLEFHVIMDLVCAPVCIYIYIY